jgi:hypothetical protein
MQTKNSAYHWGGESPQKKEKKKWEITKETNSLIM